MSKIVIIISSVVVLLFILLLLVPFMANKLFNQQVTEEVKELFTYNVEADGEVVQTKDVKELPACVQKWLDYSGVIGKEKITSVRLKQDAVMRLEKDKAWMPVKAEQYFTTANPGFIWKARIKAAPLFHIAGRDKYYKGKGNMLIKLMSIITIADSKGEEMDQGTMLRFLAESVWFPTFALSDYLKWEEIDASTAKATMSYGGITSFGIFKYNNKGEVVNFTADRYREEDGQYSLAKWSIDMRDYKEFNGVKIPTRGEVTWKLDDGDFTWFKFEIKDINYNKPVVY